MYRIFNSYSTNSSRIWADSRQGALAPMRYQPYTTRVSGITVLLYTQALDKKQHNHELKEFI